MKLLLDTHALLWFLADDPRLSASARTTMEDPANPRLLSPVSLQEIAIKVQLGKLRLDEPFAVMFPAQLTLFSNDPFPLPGWRRVTGDPRSGERRGWETAAERNRFATKAVRIRGRSRPTLQHASPMLPLHFY